MEEQTTSLSPRETALRMLKHMPDDVSYEDIVRQLRILRQIDWAVDGAASTDRSGRSGGGDSEEEAGGHTRSKPDTEPYPADTSPLELRSGPEFSWRSLADRTSGHSESPAGASPTDSASSRALLWTD